MNNIVEITDEKDAKVRKTLNRMVDEGRLKRRARTHDNGYIYLIANKDDEEGMSF